MNAAIALVPPIPSVDAKPTALWREALGLSENDGAELLRRAYRENWPTQGELIFTGACSFQCVHCIYPPSFARHNRSIKGAQWAGILDSLVGEAGICTFVYGGRSLTAEGVEVMAQLRARMPDSYIGMIDNGISMLPHRDALKAVKANWIDVSLDGQAADHDRQRGKAGSYAEGLAGAVWLKDNGLAPKVNILTCLTTLNYRSVCAMIREVNALGFKNFFITPVTLGDANGPAPELMLSREQFCEFVAELRTTLVELNDAWVELLLFSAEYAHYVASGMGEIWEQLIFGRDEMSWNLSGGNHGANVLFMRYSPLSLTGIRELIVNTNGDVLVPKAMVSGKVKENAIVGNLLNQTPIDVLINVPNTEAFNFYCAELHKEAELLRRYV